jgi:16S rRNA (cytosine1402-N4)-methyltransferase
MNRKQELTAARVLNTYSEERLRNLFMRYGEIGNARQLAAVIVNGRVSPLSTVEELKYIIKPMVPKKIEHKYLAQVFQAIRIEVNDELGALKTMLRQVPKALKPGGRFVVISYHSLEDRLVKNFIRCGNFDGEPQKDFFGNISSPLEAVNRKAVLPGEEELEQNPRSRSAKLRIAIKR